LHLSFGSEAGEGSQDVTSVTGSIHPSTTDQSSRPKRWRAWAVKAYLNYLNT
jgi:hypothetical protein